MAHTTIFLLAIAVSISIAFSDVGWLSDDANNDAEFELEKKIAIDEIKARLMQELGLTEIPVRSGSSRPLSDDVIQLLLAQDDPPAHAHKQFTRLLVPPAHDNFQCKRYNSSTSCRRFEYSIAPGALYYTIEFWFYKIQSVPSEIQSISVLCLDSGDEPKPVIEHDTLVEEEDVNKWVVHHLPTLKQLGQWQGNLTCSIEVLGMVIDEVKPNLPFLIMAQDLDAHSRTKRSEDMLEGNVTCKPISFNVSFDEIGLGDYIVFPQTYEVYLCKGYCLPSFQDTIVDLAFQRNSTLEREHGRCWNTCCRPKTYGQLRLIHRVKDGSGMLVDSYFQNVVVTACWCR